MSHGLSCFRMQISLWLTPDRDLWGCFWSAVRLTCMIQMVWHQNHIQNMNKNAAAIKNTPTLFWVRVIWLGFLVGNILLTGFSMQVMRMNQRILLMSSKHFCLIDSSFMVLGTILRWLLHCFLHSWCQVFSIKSMSIFVSCSHLLQWKSCSVFLSMAAYCVRKHVLQMACWQLRGVNALESESNIC